MNADDGADERGYCGFVTLSPSAEFTLSAALS